MHYCPSKNGTESLGVRAGAKCKILLHNELDASLITEVTLKTLKSASDK
jgi:hypothetical protein